MQEESSWAKSALAETIMKVHTLQETSASVTSSQPTLKKTNRFVSLK
jgi:hypothetical protein